MAQSLGFDDFKPGKVDLLRSFCKKRGLVVSGRRKDELVALAFAAVCQNLPVVLDKDGESKEAGDDYGKLLILLNGTVIPDPLQLSDGWVSDKDGVSLWPLCMILNISDYLISRNERPLCDRLRNDYKEGW